MTPTAETRHIVLLGDSIFDNAAYVPDGTPVIEHVRSMLPGGWQVTLLAFDGAVTDDVVSQSKRMPATTTHLIISAGGNDTLQSIGVFSEPVTMVGEALHLLAEVRTSFQQHYRRMLEQVLRLNLPVAVCSIYNAIPGLGTMEKTALALFNETILSEAFRAGVPLIDLRHVCDESDDYSTLSPIEPSQQGGEKIARAILSLLEMHDFSLRHSLVVSGDPTEPATDPVPSLAQTPENDEPPTEPSPFYEQFKHARPYLLEYPLGSDKEGPHWLPDGALDPNEMQEWEAEEIDAVALGGDRYQVACIGMMPFSSLKLRWGDIIHAEETEPGELRLKHIEIPMPYVHYSSLSSGPFRNDIPPADLVHRLGGGWETVMGGYLTVSIPAGRAEEFERLTGWKRPAD